MNDTTPRTPKRRPRRSTDATLQVLDVRLVLYRYGRQNRPELPLLLPNRYGDRLVGYGLRLPAGRILSLQWRQA